MRKQNLIGMNLHDMENLLNSLQQPKYRSGQLFNWIYKKRVLNFHDMSNFPRQLRSQLNDIAVLCRIELVKTNSSHNKDTIKFLFQMEDGLCIESIFMLEGKRRTVCLSSQIGCGLNCKFCATGKMGFIRNLSTGEILEQLLFIQRYLKTEVTNIVLMGMGEPFLNYDNVMKACALMSDDNGIAVGKRKITISTSGIVPAIKRFADEGQKYKLAISLNAPRDTTRNMLMPINKTYSIGEIINAARYYTNKSKNRITFEYVLISGVNDSKEDATALKKLLTQLPCKLNLIPYNESDNVYKRSTDQQIDLFMKPFLNMNIVISVRRSKGDEIKAACGQLFHEATKIHK